MSSDETKSALSRAFELVEAGRYDEAREILDPILDADRNNADAWWIYAHAVTNPEDGTDALENVLRINPRYPGAQELLGQARQLFPEKPSIKRVTGSVPVAAPPVSFPEEFPETDAERIERTTQEQKVLRASAPRSSSTVPLLIAGAVVVVVVAAVIILLSQNTSQPPPTPTAALVAPTLIQATDIGSGAATEEPTEAATAETPATEVLPPTEDVATEAVPTEVSETEVAATDIVVTVQILPTQTTAEIEPTESSATSEAATPAVDGTAQVAAESYEAITTALASFPLAEAGIGQVETTFGNTLMVTVCTTRGPAMRSLLPQVMNALAEQSTALGSDVAAVGVRLLDCTQNAPLLIVATELVNAQSYAAGTLDDGAFAATWKPQPNS